MGHACLGPKTLEGMNTMTATHSHEGEKVERSIESIIFHHADFFDFDIAKFLGRRAGA